MPRLRITALLLSTAIQASAATGGWHLASQPEPGMNPVWWTNLCNAWSGRVYLVSSSYHAQLVAPDGQLSDRGISIYYVPVTRRYGILDYNGVDYNDTFVLRDKIAIYRLDQSLYCYARALTNTIPDGADPIPYLETQCREYFRNYTPRTIPETHAITYFGYYLGEGQITRDPSTHEIRHVNHFAFDIPQLSSCHSTGTNAIVHIAAGGGADLIFDEDMKPIGGIRGGTNVIVDPANNTYFTQKSWGQPVEGLRLAMNLNKTAFKSGEPIPATIWVQNVTNVYRDYFPNILQGQVLTVTDNSGNALPTIASQHPPKTFLERVNATRVDTSLVRVQPGAHVNIEVNVTAQYELTTPGRYNLKFALKVATPDEKAFPVAVTPEMPVTILPK